MADTNTKPLLLPTYLLTYLLTYFWTNDLLIYRCRIRTCFWQRRLLFWLQTVFLHKIANINTLWHWLWLLFTYYISKLQNFFTIATLLKDLKFLILDYIILVLLLRPCLNQVIVEIGIIPMILTGPMSLKRMHIDVMLKPVMINALDIWND